MESLSSVSPNVDVDVSTDDDSAYDDARDQAEKEPSDFGWMDRTLQNMTSAVLSEEDFLRCRDSLMRLAHIWLFGMFMMFAFMGLRSVREGIRAALEEQIPHWSWQTREGLSIFQDALFIFVFAYNTVELGQVNSVYFGDKSAAARPRKRVLAFIFAALLVALGLARVIETLAYGVIAGGDPFVMHVKDKFTHVFQECVKSILYNE
jgi:hypothetical protein